MTRVERFLQICRMVGETVTVVDAGDGWPGRAIVRLSANEQVPVNLHVSAVSTHSRREYEMRFQNPGDRQPVRADEGVFPLLVGYAEVRGRSLLVAVDGRSRVGRNARFSILFNRSALEEARNAGWSVYESSKGEKIYALIPELLPVFIQLARSELAASLPQTAEREIQVAIMASGLTDDANEASTERARRTTSQLVRNYAFGGSVVHAYNELCAMCGLDSGLVVGAHIKPASAPNSPDRVWNGLALCHNHHAAFDMHKIWVHPETRRVHFRPDVLEQAEHHPAVQLFTTGTYETLANPVMDINRPRVEMFADRYLFYDRHYAWV